MTPLTAAPPAAPEALEPLASAPLRLRFPHLADGMDAEQMRARLQSVLLDRTGFVAEACELPKADVVDGACRIQYQLRVRTPAGDREQVLVLGTMLSGAGSAARFERDVLAPLAEPWAGRGSPAFRPTGVVGPLDMAVSVFPVSAMLPTLMDVTDRRRMTGALGSILGTEEASQLDGIELVRLRRTPRCVLRYRFGPGGHRVIYGKVGSTAGDNSVRRGLEALAHRVGQAANGTVLFPTMLGRRPDLDLALFRAVPGSRADIGVAGVIDAVIGGAALAAASMHTSGIDIGALRTLDGHTSRVRNAIQLIQGDATDLARWLTWVADSAATIVRDSPAQAPFFAHGDFTLSQLLFDGSHVGLLDFDGLCQAEPAYDLGRFVAYLRLALAKSTNPDGDVLAARFLATYHSLGGPHTCAIRVRHYAIGSLILMAVRSWQQLKPRRLRLVCGVLEQEVSKMGDLNSEREGTA